MVALLSRSRQAILIRSLSSFGCCIWPNIINPSSFQITIQSESLLCYESHLIKYLSWNMKITTLQEKKPTIEVTIWSRHKNTAIQQSLHNMTNMLSSCLNYKLMYLYRLIDACLNYHVHLQSISTGNIYSTTILRISSKETVSKWLDHTIIMCPWFLLTIFKSGKLVKCSFHIKRTIQVNSTFKLIIEYLK